MQEIKQTLKTPSGAKQILDNLDDLTDKVVKTLSQALAKKDKTISELETKLKDLEATINDLDYLLNSGRNKFEQQRIERLKELEAKIKQLKKNQIEYCEYKKSDCQKIASYQHFLKLGWVKLDKGYICSNCKEFLEDLKEKKNQKEPIILLDEFEKDDSSKLTKIQGILTSSIRPKPSSDTPFYGYLRPDNANKHSLAECEASKCQSCEIPVVFRFRGEMGEWIEPIFKKGDKVILEGEFSESKQSNRPSFTCYSYQIINDHE